MPVFNVHHSTTYRYRRPVGLGEHRLMLRPCEGEDQRLLGYDLTIEPRPAELHWDRDLFGNPLGVARFSGRVTELRFEMVAAVAVEPSHPKHLEAADERGLYPLVYSDAERRRLDRYMDRAGAADHAVRHWAEIFLNQGRPTAALDILSAVTQAIRRDHAYVRRAEKGIQAPAETLASGAGTCRDFTVLMIAAVRALGLPARFVSGYLYVPSRDRRDVHGGGATHAWVQVYLPGAGWIDFDPTNGTVGNKGLIRVAVSAEPEGAVPLSGSYSGLASDHIGMDVVVRVTSTAEQATQTIQADNAA